MPNWCMNKVNLKHDDTEKLQELKNFLENDFNNEKGLFSFFRPRPEEMTDWYEWSMQHWGTKWDISRDDTSWDIYDDNHAYLMFPTAWTPPIELFRFLESIEWEVTGYYYEPGANYIGRYSYGYDQCHSIGARGIDSDILEPWELYLSEMEEEQDDEACVTSEETRRLLAEDPDSEI